MKFLKKIKRWFKPKETIKVNDKLFGELTLKELSNPNSNFWIGHVFFKPNNTQIEYFIHTKRQNLPNSEQRYFFLSLNQNYPSLSKLWNKTIDGEIGASLLEMGINLENVPLKNYFKLSHIEIPERFHDDANWSVTFFAAPEIDPNHEFTIHMRGWNSLGLSING